MVENRRQVTTAKRLGLGFIDHDSVFVVQLYPRVCFTLLFGGSYGWVPMGPMHK